MARPGASVQDLKTSAAFTAKINTTPSQSAVFAQRASREAGVDGGLGVSAMRHV
jgi:hypothetical protein